MNIVQGPLFVNERPLQVKTERLSSGKLQPFEPHGLPLHFQGDQEPPSFLEELFGSIVQFAQEFMSSPKEAFQKNVENRLLYHPEVGGVSKDKIQNEALRAKVQEVTFQASDGVKLHSWYVPAQSGMPTVVFAHGNAGNISHREYIMEPLSKAGYGILMFDYRGFGNSEGTPNEKGLYLDFEAASQYLKDVAKVPYEKQIASGESLGGAVAIDAASKRPYRALFVWSTFASLAALAPVLTKDLPVIKDLGDKLLPNLVQQEFNSLEKIKSVQCPILIAHGDQDELVPFEMSEKLYDGAMKAPYKDHVTAGGCDHNNVFGAMPEALLEALKRVLDNTANLFPPS